MNIRCEIIIILFTFYCWWKHIKDKRKLENIKKCINDTIIWSNIITFTLHINQIISLWINDLKNFTAVIELTYNYNYLYNSLCSLILLQFVFMNCQFNKSHLLKILNKNSIELIVKSVSLFYIFIINIILTIRVRINLNFILTLKDLIWDHSKSFWV